MVADNWSGEGGTNGTQVSSGNSGGASGNAMVPSIPAGTNITYTSAEKMHGSFGVEFARASGTGTFYMMRDHTAAGRKAIRFYFKLPALPSQNLTLCAFRNSVNGQSGFMRINASNKLELTNASNVAVNAATAALSATTWYRIDLGVAPGASSSTGAAEWAYYAGDSTSPIQAALTTTTADFGTTPDVRYVRFGRTGDSWINSVFMDDMAVDNLPTASTFIGPAGIIAPTPVDTSRDGYLIDFHTSTAGIAGALSYGITQLSGPADTPVLLSTGIWLAQQHATTDRVYRVTVSESGGTSATGDTTVVKVPSTGVGGPELVFDGTIWR